MTSVQVNINSFYRHSCRLTSLLAQNVFLIDDGDIRGEIERRKFTAEEGDHLTALNAYNAFVKCKLDHPLLHPYFTMLTSTQLQSVGNHQNGVTQ